jgi:hypothetical protein
MQAGLLFSFILALLTGLPCKAEALGSRASRPLMQARRSSAPDLFAQFSQNPMWTGSDGAYSVDLHNGKALWLFSDTFIGIISGGKRQNNDLINNSIGLQDISAGKMTFYWKQKQKPGSYFPEENGYWLWLGDGAFYKNKVYCFAKRISSIPGHKNEPFGFVYKQDELIVIDNSSDDPAHWQCRHLLLPFTGTELHFGTACLIDGKMLYVMGLHEKTRQSLLARIPLADLEKLNLEAFEFLHKDKDEASWSNKTSDCAPLFEKAAAEASISKVGNKYLCILHPGGSGARIVGRTAPTLSGPWSEEKLLYTIPDDLFKRGMCYAAKGHPEQPCQRGSMIVTYLINPGPLEAHEKDPYIYYPRVVEVQIPD